MHELGFEKGFIIREPWIDKILNGEKSWEMRTRNAPLNVIGTRVGLIKAGSGTICGSAVLSKSFGPIGIREMAITHSLHGIDYMQDSKLLKWNHVWVLLDRIKFDKPVPYKHPRGAVVWINF